MNKNDILTLHNAGVVRRVAERKVIHVTDTTIRHVFFLQKGLIKISNITDTGEEIIKYFVKPGTIFGELNLLSNGEDHHEIAIALKDSEIVFIPADIVKELTISNICFRNSIHQSISTRIKKMETRMFSMAKAVKERVMDFLQEFAVEFGEPVNGGYVTNNFLTHEDIAGITSTSRQSVTTWLIYFKKRGLIDYNSKTVSILHFHHS
jgi:CRP/FNR family transcriptional regulator, cyclic AMP receptor protein